MCRETAMKMHPTKHYFLSTNDLRFLNYPVHELEESNPKNCWPLKTRSRENGCSKNFFVDDVAAAVAEDRPSAKVGEIFV